MSIEPILGPVDVAVSGMQAQNASLSAIYTNLANALTTDAGGKPYKRVEAILTTDGHGPVAGVKVDKIVEDNSPFPEVYNPGHPKADARGYVKMPNVSIPREMVNLAVATRAYQANAAVLRRYQQAVDAALELLR